VSEVEAIDMELRKLEFVLKRLRVLTELQRMSDEESNVLFKVNSPLEKSLMEENKVAWVFNKDNV